MADLSRADRIGDPSGEGRSVPPTDSVEEAVRLIRTHAVRRLPEVDGGRAVGAVIDTEPPSAVARPPGRE